ncbi:class I SAM-dependent methyltransferase [Candidatus Micrarchaeota archaeon]|nr:class I SAM-dependent methyltransferase [Candidatus Micrarchaeota archaeon]
MDKYFKTKEGIEEYDKQEATNVRYNHDLLGLCGLSKIPTNGAKVLDIGCGFGLMLKSLYDMGADCYGADISELAIRTCRQRFPMLNCKVCDFSETIRFEEKFNLMISFGTFGLITKDKHKKLIDNILSALSPNGIFFATAPNANRPFFMDVRKRRSDSYNNARTEQEWKDLLLESGFSDVEVFSVLRLPKSQNLFGKNLFIRIGLGDPIVLCGRKKDDSSIV